MAILWLGHNITTGTLMVLNYDIARVATLEAKSVITKLKDKFFGTKVDRDGVILDASLLGVSVANHFTSLIEALRPISYELGIEPGLPDASVNVRTDATGADRRSCCGCDSDSCLRRQTRYESSTDHKRNQTSA